jgi:hypothetical protein
MVSDVLSVSLSSRSNNESIVLDESVRMRRPGIESWSDIESTRSRADNSGSGLMSLVLWRGSTDHFWPNIHPLADRVQRRSPYMKTGVVLNPPRFPLTTFVCPLALHAFRLCQLTCLKPTHPPIQTNPRVHCIRHRPSGFKDWHSFDRLSNKTGSVFLYHFDCDRAFRMSVPSLVRYSDWLEAIDYSSLVLVIQKVSDTGVHLRRFRQP